MAITDHTEASRPSLRKKSQPTSALTRKPHRMAASEKTQQCDAAVIAGIASTHQGIADLLDHTYAYREAHPNDAGQDSEQIDVLVKTMHGLFTATYFLKQYVATLLHKPGDETR